MNCWLKKMVQLWRTPTWEYLHDNFTKVQIQKHCRQLGLTKVWLTKDKLVDMIMRHHRSNLTAQAIGSRGTDEPDPLADIWLELCDIKKNMNKKDTKIEELNDLLKNAHITINRLNDRISTLEEQIIRQRIPSTVNMDDEKTILLLGNGNLNEVCLSDLEEGCSVKTVKDSTVDLLQCWVNEKLEWAPDKCIIYCGINDLLETQDVGKTLDDLGNLTSELKIRNENIEVFVCELAPSLKNDLNGRIDNFNKKNWMSGVM